MRPHTCLLWQLCLCACMLVCPLHRRSPPSIRFLRCLQDTLETYAELWQQLQNGGSASWQDYLLEQVQSSMTTTFVTVCSGASCCVLYMLGAGAAVAQCCCCSGVTSACVLC